MSAGLKLLRAIVENVSTNSFRELNEDWFSENAEETLAYRFVKEHIDHHGRLPALNTCLENGIALPFADEPASYYRETVNNRYLYNVIRPLYERLHGCLVSNRIEEATEVIREMHVSCRSANFDSSISEFGESVEKLKEAYNERSFKVGYSGITFGYETLNEYTDGMYKQDLIAFVGRMGVGKTYVMCHTVKEVLETGKSVLFITLEMSKEQLQMRLAALWCNIKIEDIRHGRLDMFTKQRYFDALDEISGLNALHFMEAGLHRSRGQKQLYTRDLENAIEEVEPDLVIVDGAYLMHVDKSSSYKARWERITEVADDLKRIAIKRDVPIGITVQFNRDQSSSSKSSKVNQEKELDIANISGSDNIAMVCSVVVGIKKSSHPNKLELHQLKNREGDLCKVRINSNFESMDFSQDMDITNGEELEDDIEMAVSLENQI